MASETAEIIMRVVDASASTNVTGLAAKFDGLGVAAGTAGERMTKGLADFSTKLPQVEIDRLKAIIAELDPVTVAAAGGVDAAMKRITALEARANVKALDTAILDLAKTGESAAPAVTRALESITVTRPIASVNHLGKNILGLVGNGAEAAAGLVKELGHLVFSGTTAAVGALGKTILDLVKTGIEAAAGLTKELGHLVFTGTERVVMALGRTILDLAVRAGEAAVGMTKELGHLAFTRTIEAIKSIGAHLMELPKQALAAAAGIKGALDSVGTHLHDGITTIADWGRNIIDWAKKAAIGIGLVTAALTVVGVEAAKSSVSFQTMTNQIQNNTTMTTADLNVMKQTIKNFSAETGAPLDQLGQGFMHAFNMMGNASDATVVLETAMRSAVSTGSNVSDVTETLAKIMHQFSIPTKDAAKTMDQLHLASALGNTTLEEFTTNTAKAMVAAANLHVPLEDVLAGFVGLTRSGYDAANASTQIAGILTHLINPTKAAHKELVALSKATGIDLVGDFSLAGLKAKGLTAIMQDVEAATRGNEDAILKLIPAQRGAIGALALTGNAAGDVTEAMKMLNGVINGGATPTMDAYTRTTQTAGFQWDRLKASIHLAAITLGDVFLPSITRTLEWINTNMPHGIDVMKGFFHAFQSGGFGAGFASIEQSFAPLIAKIQEYAQIILSALTSWGMAFLDWLIPVIPQLITRVVGVGLTIVSTVIGYLPVIAQTMLQVAQVMTEWVTNTAVPRLLETLPELLVVIGNFITSALPIISHDILFLAGSLADWVTNTAVPLLIAHLPAWLGTLTSFITSALPILTKHLWNIGVMFADWVTTSAVPMLLAALPLWLTTLGNFIAAALPVIANHTLALGKQMAVWIGDTGIPLLVSYLPQWLNTILNFIDGALPVITVTVIRVAHEMADWLTKSAIPMLSGHLSLWLNTIADFITAALPIIAQVLTGVRDLLHSFILAAIPIVRANLGGWLVTIATFIRDAAVSTAQFLLPFARQFYEWITDTAIPFLRQHLPEWLATIGGFLVTAATAVKDFIVPIAKRFYEWITDTAIPYLKTNLPLWLTALGTWLTQTAFPWVHTKLTDLATLFGDWVNDTAVPWLLANLPKWLNAMTDWLTQTALPAIITGFFQVALAFNQWIIEHAIPWLLVNLPKFLMVLLNWIQETLIPDVQRMIVRLAERFFLWIGEEVLPKIVPELARIGVALDNWISEKANALAIQLEAWSRAFVSWVGQAVRNLPNALDGILRGINEWVDSILPRLEAKGRDMAGAMLRGLGNMAGNILGGIGNAVGGIFGGSSQPQQVGGGSSQPQQAGGYYQNGRFYANGTAAPTIWDPRTHQYHYADGTDNAPGGWSVVGERGPELLNIPKGSQVIPHDRSMAMGGGTTVHVHVAGSILTARGVAEDVRTELLRMQRQGIALGFTT